MSVMQREEDLTCHLLALKMQAAHKPSNVGSLQKPEKGRETESSPSLPKGCSLASSLSLAQWDLFCTLTSRNSREYIYVV